MCRSACAHAFVYIVNMVCASHAAHIDLRTLYCTGQKSKVSPEGSQGRSTTVMRATHMHSASKSAHDGSPATPSSQSAVPITARTHSLPAPPAFGTPLGRCHSFSASQHEVGGILGAVLCPVLQVFMMCETRQLLCFIIWRGPCI